MNVIVTNIVKQHRFHIIRTETYSSRGPFVSSFMCVLCIRETSDNHLLVHFAFVQSFVGKNFFCVTNFQNNLKSTKSNYINTGCSTYKRYPRKNILIRILSTTYISQLIDNVWSTNMTFSLISCLQKENSFFGCDHG